jgi:hypothetical protein
MLRFMAARNAVFCCTVLNINLVNATAGSLSQCTDLDDPGMEFGPYLLCCFQRGSGLIESTK